MIKGFSFKNLSQAINKYDNILVAGDLNIDVSGSKGLNDNHFSEMIDTFNLTNLVKTPTCFHWMCYSQISQILYKKLVFVKRDYATAIKWYLQSFTQLILDYPPPPLKIIKYRNYKGFNENIFFHEVDQTLLKGEIYK